MVRSSAVTSKPTSAVLPAHAGMVRVKKKARRRGGAFSPHTRGWSDHRRQVPPRGLRSPRTRGDGPNFFADASAQTGVLPAHAGMVCSNTRAMASPTAVLPAHAGMVRLSRMPPDARSPFSPHTRGWSALYRAQHNLEHGSPRTRGDGPAIQAAEQAPPERSPRTRGDGPKLFVHRTWLDGVLPAHAGMVR